ncbi:MAG: DUF2442 domain-containing protein [Thermoanaerobaculia bacterium]
MPSFDYCVVSVEVIGHLRLKVRFRDGLTGEVLFKETHLSGVFKPLRDPVFFARVSCADGFVEWPGEIDLAPDAMYEEIQANGAWILD